MSEARPAASRAVILLAALTSGAAVLALEVLAARTMAPALGTGSVAWSALLAVALGSLAAGNFLGGLLADRAPPAALVAWLLAVPAAAVVVLSQIYAPLMRWAAEGSLLGSALTAAAVTQCLPMLMLGALTPALLKAGADGPLRGRWAGAILALGSAGGIAGALAAGLWLLPAVGLSRSYLAVAAVLATSALMVALRPRRQWFCAALAAAVLIAAAVLAFRAAPTGVIQSPYGQIEVRTDGPMRVLLIDGLPQTGLPSEVAPGEALHHGYLLEAALALRPQIRTALVVGLGAGLAPRILEARGICCDAVEIDPRVVDVAQRELGFAGRATVADGRRFLTGTSERWDLIVLDVCTSDRLAFHLFTAEALATARRRLAPGGLVAVQFIGDDGPWSAALARTAAEVFGEPPLVLAPAGRLWPVGPRWLFAAPQAMPDAEMLTRAWPEAPWQVLRNEPGGALLTDDHFAAELDWARVAVRWRQLYAFNN